MINNPINDPPTMEHPAFQANLRKKLRCESKPPTGTLNSQTNWYFPLAQGLDEVQYKTK
jgi:hypothetical protein